jgi:two-component system NarL family sensor kinase
MYAEQEQYTKALHYAKTGIAHSRQKALHRKGEIIIYKRLSRIYHKMGHNDSAYHYLYAYQELSDSLNFLEKEKAFINLEKQFQLSEKEKEIAQKENKILTQQQQVRNRNIWIAAIGLGIFVLTVLMLIFYRNVQRKYFILQQQKEIDKLKATIEGEENERKRIAVDLHDNVGGLLTSAQYKVENMKQEKGESNSLENIDKIGTIIEVARNEIRKTAHILMPDVLLRHGLAKAIEIYTIDIEKDTGLPIDVQIQGRFDHLSKDVQLNFYRIMQELFQNILKHAAASKVCIQLLATPGITSLTVEDDGRGFDPETTQLGMGLENIRNRILIYDGVFSINAAKGKGTSIYIEMNDPPV